MVLSADAIALRNQQAALAAAAALAQQQLINATHRMVRNTMTDQANFPTVIVSRLPGNRYRYVLGNKMAYVTVDQNSKTVTLFSRTARGIWKQMGKSRFEKSIRDEAFATVVATMFEQL